MKVELLYPDRYIPSTEGGGRTYLDEADKAIIDYRNLSRHQFCILSFEDKPSDFENGENLQWIRIRPPLNERLRGEKAYLWRKFVLRHRKPVTFSEWRLAEERERSGIECALITRPQSRGPSNIPYIATVWDLEHRKKPMFPEVSAKGELEHRENHYKDHLGKAARILVGTPEGKREIEAFYCIPAERISVVPMPTPAFALDGANDEGSRPESIPEALTGRFVYYPAQFWPHKNHVALLRALCVLKEKWSIEVPVVFTGSDKGNLSFVQKTAEALGIRSQVYFPGFVSREELIWLYRHSLALGYVSLFGPDNLPPLEAFALGCPVIAARLQGAEGQLGDAVLFVDPRDEGEIAEAIKRVRSDSEFREELIRKGKDRAAANTPRHYAERIFAVLDDLELYRRCWGTGGSFT